MLSPTGIIPALKCILYITTSEPFLIFVTSFYPLHFLKNFTFTDQLFFFFLLHNCTLLSAGGYRIYVLQGQKVSQMMTEQESLHNRICRNWGEKLLFYICHK